MGELLLSLEELDPRDEPALLAGLAHFVELFDAPGEHHERGVMVMVAGMIDGPVMLAGRGTAGVILPITTPRAFCGQRSATAIASTSMRYSGRDRVWTPISASAGLWFPNSATRARSIIGRYSRR